jgi:tRNA threonylcarbamoyladenosine biosynthesis protein TsaB
MIFLTIRTDKPEAEIGLFDGSERLAYESWPAHRELSDTIHRKIDELLKSQDKTMTDVAGIAAYQGPGSFTGLRIGLTVANALAYSYSLPVVATTGNDWITVAGHQLQHTKLQQYILPEYGGEANITLPRK